MAPSLPALLAHNPYALWLSFYEAAGITTSGSTATVMIDYSGNGRDGTVLGSAPSMSTDVYTTWSGARPAPLTTATRRHRFQIGMPAIDTNTGAIFYMGPMFPAIQNLGSEVQIIMGNPNQSAMEWRYGVGPPGYRRGRWNGADIGGLADNEIPDGTLAHEERAVLGYILTNDGGDVRLLGYYDLDDGAGVQFFEGESLGAGTGTALDCRGIRNEGVKACGMLAVWIADTPDYDGMVDFLIESAKWHSESLYEALTEEWRPTPDPIPPDPPRWTRRDLRIRRPMWLLELLVGGRELLYAEQPVAIEDSRGRIRVYQEGLGGLVEGVAGEGELERSISVTLDAAADWSALTTPGRSLERAPARLLRWPDGALYELARPVLEGQARGLAYGGELEPITFAVVRAAARADGGVVPPARAVVDASTWPVAAGYAVAEAALGAGYPLIIGQPGSATVPASSCPLVETDHASLTADRVVVSVAPVVATQVEVFDVTDAGAFEAQTLAIVATADAAGRTVQTAIVGGQFAVATTSKRRYQASWIHGGGVRNPSTGALLRGAGDVIEWLITTFSRVAFDSTAFGASRDVLNSYLLDFYLDDRTDVQELVGAIAAMLPVHARQGRNGLYYALRRLEIRPEDAIASLSADRLEVQRDGGIEVDSDGIVNEVAVSFAPAGSSDRYTRRLILTGQDRADELAPGLQLGTDARVETTYRATLSQREYGVLPIEIDLPLVWDAATARRVALDTLALQTGARRFVRYSGGWELEAVEPDQVVLIADEETGLDAAPALVLDVEIGGPSVALDLMLYDDPVLS
jgi:hypothetical protein